MPEVFIDGEKVEFRGESPGSIGHVLSLVQGVLSGRSRVLSAARIDGNDFQDEQTDVPFGDVGRIDVESLSEHEALGRISTSSIEEIQRIATLGSNVSAEVLRLPWRDVRARCVALAEDCGTAVQNISVLVDHCGEESAFGRAAVGINEALDKWIDAVGQGDAAAVCLSFQLAVLPAFERLKSELAKMTVPET